MVMEVLASMGLSEVGVLVYRGNDSDVDFCAIQGPVAGTVTLLRLKYVPK
jgi:hypothetical protein